LLEPSATRLQISQRRLGRPAHTGLALTSRLFTAWHAYDEHQDRDRLIVEMTPIQNELRELLQDAATNSKRTK